MDLQAHTDCSKTAYVAEESTLLARIRGEFLEMPGMHLSFEQAARLWAIDADTCRHALDCLMEAGFLRRDGNGRFGMAHDGY
jgi:Fic family protein